MSIEVLGSVLNWVKCDPGETSLWLLERYYPGSPINNLCTGIATSGTFDHDAIRNAIISSILRHEALRDVYCVRGGELWKANVPAAAEQFEVDIRFIETSSTDAVAAEISFVDESFDLDGGVLVRAAVFTTPEISTLLIVVHHLNFDATSAGILLNDVIDAYNSDVLNASAPILEPTHRYVAPTASAASVRYWRGVLDRLGEKTLGLSYSAPEGVASQGLFAGEMICELTRQERQALQRLRTDLQTTEPIVMLALYATLLALHKQGSTVLIGMPVDIRPPRYKAAVGNHVHLIPIVVDVDTTRRFREICADVQRVVIDGLSASDHDTGLDVANNAGARGIQYAFNYVRYGDNDNAAVGTGVGTKVLVRNSHSRFDLELVCIENDDRRTFQIKYRTDALGQEQASDLLTRLRGMILEVDERPDRCTGELAVTDTELRIIDRWNDTTRPLSYQNVLDRIRAVVSEFPDRIAVSDGLSRLTYDELWNYALRVSEALRQAGGVSGDVVALVLPRGAELAGAVLGILEVGASYLPIDPSESDERVRQKVTIADARFVVDSDGVRRLSVSSADNSSLPVPTDADTADPSAAGADVAYVIFTSGSTGAPKAVRVRHASLANVVTYFQRLLAVGASDIVGWSTTFGFDISTLELFLPLVSGGQLAVISDARKTSAANLIDAVREEKLTVLQGTPTLLSRLIMPDEDLTGVSVLCGGETLSYSTAEQLKQTGATVYNVYGPTETTIWSSAKRIDRLAPGVRPDIGNPIDNTIIRVTDDHGNEVPIGTIGEIRIGGLGVALDYYGDPERTRDKFVSSGGTAAEYRTGDLGRRHPDGSVEILGRCDRQIKLNGVRIELGEIEAAIGDLELSNFLVVALGGGDSPKTLAICVEGSPPEGTRDKIRSRILDRLPPACHTARIEFLDRLPTTSNGKLDAKAIADVLAEIPDESPSVDHDSEALRFVLEWFRKSFSDQTVDADSNYFDLGGNSLMGAQLLQSINDEWGVELNLGDLADLRTVAKIAQSIESRGP